MTDLGQVKPTFVNRLHQKANLGHIVSPTAPLKVPMGPKALQKEHNFFQIFTSLY